VIRFYREVIYKYTLKNVNLRLEPSVTSDILAVIPEGSKIQVIDMEDEWSRYYLMIKEDGLKTIIYL